MTHSEGFFPPDYESPLPVPDGSSTKVDGVAKNFAPPAVPPVPDTEVDGVPVDWDPPPAVPPAFTHSVDGVAFEVSRDGHDQPLPEPPAFTHAVDGVPFENSRDGHDQPLPDPDGGSWTLTASLVLLLGLLGFLGGCRAPWSPYRPGGMVGLPVVHVDPRPDLPGIPIVEGHPLFNLLEFLESAAPAGRPVDVRSVPLVDPCLGVTHQDVALFLQSGDRRSLVVEIRDDIPGWLQRDVLIHEWAHAMAWDVRESAHGPCWSAFHGHLYRLTRGE